MDTTPASGAYGRGAASLLAVGALVTASVVTFGASTRATDESLGVGF